MHGFLTSKALQYLTPRHMKTSVNVWHLRIWWLWNNAISTQGDPVTTHAGEGQGAMNFPSISKPELRFPMHLQGWENGCAELTISRAPQQQIHSNLKVCWALHYNYKSDHSSGGAWCGDSCKGQVPSESVAPWVLLKKLSKVTVFLLSTCTAHPGEGHVKRCSPAQSNDPISLFAQFFPLATLTIQN